MAPAIDYSQTVMPKNPIEMVNKPKIRVLLSSFLKFSGVGLFITFCSAAGYWLLATPAGLDPNLSLVVVFVIFTIVGHRLHGAVSFRDKTGGTLPRNTVIRFSVVNLVGFAMNQASIMILVKVLGYQNWVPIVPMIFVTPIVVFVLNRYWVFHDDASA